MRALIVAVLATGSLLLAVPLAGWAQAAQPAGGASLEQVLVESANTPAEHAALGRYFREKAAQQRKSAADHQWMAKSYGGSLKGPAIAQQKVHCEKLVSLHEQTAAQYDEMAKAHEDAAKAK